eukprot:1788692-Prymnesium_polylepis.2
MQVSPLRNPPPDARQPMQPPPMSRRQGASRIPHPAVSALSSCAAQEEASCALAPSMDAWPRRVSSLTLRLPDPRALPGPVSAAYHLGVPAAQALWMCRAALCYDSICTALPAPRGGLQRHARSRSPSFRASKA